jgi:hypothetical protein
LLSLTELFGDISICFLAKQSSQFFVVSTCPTPSQIGSSCNISSTPCDMSKPCQNNGTCINNNTDILSYICLCLFNFNGTECQYDNRPCQPNTCWNNGILKKNQTMKLFISF